MPEQRYLTIDQTATYLGMSVKTLRFDIDNKPESIPPFIVLGNNSGKWRTIRFDKEDLVRWMNLRKNRREEFVLTEAEA